MKFYLHLIYCLLLFNCKVIAQQQTVGVTIHNKEEVSDGYIFFSPMRYESAYLVDNCGYKINEWQREFLPGLGGYFLDNGLMLRTNKYGSSTFFQASTGGHIELVDFDNNVVWSYPFSTDTYIQHHDAKYMPNGNILLIGWELIDVAEQESLGKSNSLMSIPYLWGEFIWEVKPIGSNDIEVVWEWHLKDHFVQDFDSSLDNYGIISENPELVDINYLGPGAWDDDDWWHCNAIDYNEELDQILLNSRNNNELWIIDHSTTTEEAQGHSGGRSGKGGDLLYRWGNPEAHDAGNSFHLKMYGSHGHHWIPKGYANEGKIMYFNNGDDRPEGYYSTVEIIDPIPDENGNYSLNNQGQFFPYEPTIVYQAPWPFDFVSTYLSNAHMLENGNVFINEGGNGRFFEINEDQEIVWEYISPVSYNGPVMQGENASSNRVFRAYKVPFDYKGLEGETLKQGDLLEGESEFNNCIKLNTKKEPLQVNSNYNMVNRLLSIENQGSSQLYLSLVNIHGVSVWDAMVQSSNESFNLNRLASGIYFLSIRNNKGYSMIEKVIIP